MKSKQSGPTSSCACIQSIPEQASQQPNHCSLQHFGPSMKTKGYMVHSALISRVIIEECREMYWQRGKMAGRHSLGCCIGKGYCCELHWDTLHWGKHCPVLNRRTKKPIT
ncbi:hypothetical protein BsWGS_14070 [Bradybaena similaris]